MRRGNSGDSRTLKAEIGIFMFARIFNTFWLKMAVLGRKIRVGVTGVMFVDPNELVLTFGGIGVKWGCYLYATLVKIDQEMRPRVRTDRYSSEDLQLTNKM